MLRMLMLFWVRCNWLESNSLVQVLALSEDLFSSYVDNCCWASSCVSSSHICCIQYFWRHQEVLHLVDSWCIVLLLRKNMIDNLLKFSMLRLTFLSAWQTSLPRPDPLAADTSQEQACISEYDKVNIFFGGLMTYFSRETSSCVLTCMLQEH